MRFFVAISLLGITGLSAQVATLQCSGAAVQTPIARAEGTTEPVSDVILTCSGGTPTPAGQAIPLSNITITLNTNITSRIIGGGGLSEATLMIDEPFPHGSGGNNPVPDAKAFTPAAGSPPQILCGGTVFPANGQGNACPETGTAGVEGVPPSPYQTQANVFSGVQTNSNSVTW